MKDLFDNQLHALKQKIISSEPGHLLIIEKELKNRIKKENIDSRWSMIIALRTLHGLILNRLSRPDQALQILNRTHKMLLRLSQNSRQKRAFELLEVQILHYIGCSYLYMKDFPNAQMSLSKAISNANLTGYRRSGEIWNSFGDLYAQIGMPEKAIRCYRQSIKEKSRKIRKSSEEITGISITLHSMGLTEYFIRRNYKVAADHFKKSLALSRKTHFFPDISITQCMIALCCFHLPVSRDEISKYEKRCEKDIKSYTVDQWDFTIASLALAAMYAKNHKKEKAIKTLQTVIDEEISTDYDHLYEAAYILEYLGETRQAEKVLLLAARNLEIELIDLPIAMKNSILSSRDQIWHRLFKYDMAKKREKQILSAIDRLLHGIHKEISVSGDARVRLFKHLPDDMENIDWLTSSWENGLETLKEQRALSDHLKCLDKLKKKDALVVFYRYKTGSNQKLITLILTKQGKRLVYTTSHQDFDKDTEILVSSLKNEINRSIIETSETDPLSLHKKLVFLGNKLLPEKASQPLKGKRRLWILSSKDFRDLPLHALAPNGTPLIGKSEVIQIHSLSDIFKPSEKKKKDQLRMFRYEYPGKAKLPLAKKEESLISKLFQSRFQASIPKNKNALLLFLSDPATSYIHFALHGIRDNRHILLSRLPLEKENLNYADIAAMDLRHLDLVFLNTCSSAGNVSSSTHHFWNGGILSAFLVAGVRFGIAAVHPVRDDETTLTFVNHFYTALAKNRNIPSSFAIACRKMGTRKHLPSISLNYQLWA